MSNTYEPGSTGICPHCFKGVQFLEVGRDCGIEWLLETSVESLTLTAAKCPLCNRLVLRAEHAVFEQDPMFGRTPISSCRFVFWPRSSQRKVPEQLPEHIAADYREAALVLGLSPKSSAALSRRCLQSVLREAAGAQQPNLSDQIDAVIRNLPTYIAENIDAIRNIGNFAAHPMKNTNSGTIVDVEPGEAEWNLDVLDSLFEFYYVQPAVAKAKRDALDTKLEALGKRPMKKP